MCTRFTQVHHRDRERAPRRVKLIRLFLAVIILYSTVQISAVLVHRDRRFRSAPQRPHTVVTQLYLLPSPIKEPVARLRGRGISLLHVPLASDKPKGDTRVSW